MSQWYRENSLVYVSQAHSLWKKEGKASKRYGRLVRSNGEVLNQMMKIHEQEVYDWMLEKIRENAPDDTTEEEEDAEGGDSDGDTIDDPVTLEQQQQQQSAAKVSGNGNNGIGRPVPGSGDDSRGPGLALPSTENGNAGGADVLMTTEQ